MQMYNIFIIFAVIMGRLLAIDYGRKRCGLAVTDVLQIVATALDTVPSAQLITYVKAYVSREPVDEIIVGLPKTPGRGAVRVDALYHSGHQPPAQGAAGSGDPLFDERFTSTLAHRAMLDAGVKKSDRRDREGAIDRMAAVIILNGYLESRRI